MFRQFFRNDQGRCHPASVVICARGTGRRVIVRADYEGLVILYVIVQLGDDVPRRLLR